MNNAGALGEKELGHLRYTASLASQLPGDWSGMGSDWWDIGEGAEQYELAFMAYMLGIVQTRYTPAYREFCDDTIAKLIKRMMEPGIWQKWILASMGGKVVDPEQEQLRPPSIDPLAKHNIMFKGHLLQMAALHEMLYRTGKYATPGAFTFEFQASTWGNGNETFAYDLPRLAEIIHTEYVESNYEGVQCEPNRVYPMCNQHAILGLIHYDQAFGAGYAADAAPKFKEAWLRKGYTNLETGSHMRLHWVRQDRVFDATAAWADGWTGVFMHAWDREFIRSLYPRERERHLDHMLAGKEHARVCCEMAPTAAKIGFGMFTALAAEVGDTEARDRLLDYADRNFVGEWLNGTFRHLRNDNWAPDEMGDSAGIDLLTANALLPMARMNSGDGLWNLYNQPWTDSKRAEPHFSRIDQKIAGVSSAHYDDIDGSLLLTLLPGPAAGDLTFDVRNLDLQRAYRVRQDDTEIGNLENGTLSDRLCWAEEGASLRIDASKATTIRLVPER
jgi:hypothetical protein